jgi:LysR family transcriptional activator of mexEF-oprN operon
MQVETREIASTLAAAERQHEVADRADVVEKRVRGHVDELLERGGHVRRVIFSSPHFATSPLVVRALPAFVTAPTFIARVWRQALGLVASPLPFEVPCHEVRAAWRQADKADPGLAWLIEQLAVAAREALG